MRRVLSLILAFIFLLCQISFGVDYHGLSRNELSPSCVSDPDINLDRSEPVRADIAKHLEPGAIADGKPLEDIARGVLPAKIEWNRDLEESLGEKIRNCIDIALNRVISAVSDNRVPAEHIQRVLSAADNLVYLRNNLSMDLYLFSADIRDYDRGSDHYCLGFNYEGMSGLSIELVNGLYGISPDLLAQYIFHECVPERGVCTDRSDHRTVYNDIQAAIFGANEVASLKKCLRFFIEFRSFDYYFEHMAMRQHMQKYGIEFSYVQNRIIGVDSIVGSDKDIIRLALVEIGRKIRHVNGLQTIVDALRHEKALFSDDEKINILAEVFASCPAYPGDRPPYLTVKDAMVFAVRMRDFAARKGGAQRVSMMSYGISDGARAYQIVKFAEVLGVDVDLIGVEYSEAYLRQARELFPRARLLAKDLIFFNEGDAAFRELAGRVDFIDASFLLHEIYTFGGRMMESSPIDRDMGLRKVNMLLANSYKLLSQEGEIIIKDGYFLPDADEPVTVSFSRSYRDAYNELAKRYEPMKLPGMDAASGRLTIPRQLLAVALDKITFLEANRRRLVSEERLSREMLEQTCYYDEASYIRVLSNLGFSTQYVCTFNYGFFEAQQLKNVDILEGNPKLPCYYMMLVAVKGGDAAAGVVSEKDITIGSVAEPDTGAVEIGLPWDPAADIRPASSHRFLADTRKMLVIDYDDDYIETLSTEARSVSPGIVIDVVKSLSGAIAEYGSGSTNGGITDYDLVVVAQNMPDGRGSDFAISLKGIVPLVIRSDYSDLDFQFVQNMLELKAKGYALGHLNRFQLKAFLPVIFEVASIPGRIIGVEDRTLRSGYSWKIRSADDLSAELEGSGSRGHSLTDHLRSINGRNEERGPAVKKDDFSDYALAVIPEIDSIESVRRSQGKIVGLRMESGGYRGDFSQFQAFIREWQDWSEMYSIRQNDDGYGFEHRDGISKEAGTKDGFYLSSVDNDGSEHMEGWITYDVMPGYGIKVTGIVLAPWNRYGNDKISGVFEILLQRVIEESAGSGYNGNVVCEMRRHVSREKFEKAGAEIIRVGSREYAVIAPHSALQLLRSRAGSLSGYVNKVSKAAHRNQAVNAADDPAWKAPPIYHGIPFSDKRKTVETQMRLNAQIFKSTLSKVLSAEKDTIFFVGIESDIGSSQMAQMMPLYKAVDELEKFRNPDGSRAFPNLVVMRGEAGEIADRAMELSDEGKLDLSKAFIIARRQSVLQAGEYYGLLANGRSWISQIDDSSDSHYMPVFETLTLTLMAYLNNDLDAIKGLYDLISREPADPDILAGMLQNRCIIVVPGHEVLDTERLRKLNELAFQCYTCA